MPQWRVPVDAPSTAPADSALLGWLLSQYVSTQLAGDRRGALRLIVEHGLNRGIPVPTLYLDVVQAAQYRIGDLWQQNRISVAQEHLATAISQLAIAELYRAAPSAAPNGKNAIVACADGEQHELGIRITADFFDMAGFDVHYLGASLPTESLVDTLRERHPDLLVVSVTMSANLGSLHQALLRTRDAVGDRTRLAVGGYAFSASPALVQQMGADIYGRDALESVAAARRLFALPG